MAHSHPASQRPRLGVNLAAHAGGRVRPHHPVPRGFPGRRQRVTASPGPEAARSHHFTGLRPHSQQGRRSVLSLLTLTQGIQDPLPSLVPCLLPRETTYSQVLGIRTWTRLGRYSPSTNTTSGFRG